VPVNEVSTLTEVTTLIGATSGLVMAIGAAIGAVTVLVKLLKRERPNAARRMAAELAVAAEDGEITADELRAIAEGSEET
jgi:hypothetical protein